MKSRPPLDVSRRGIIAGLIGAAITSRAVGAAPGARLRMARAAIATAAALTIAPSALWTGTAGSGFDPTGVSAAIEPVPTLRVLTDAVRPSMAPMFGDKMTVDRDTTFGVLANFKGRVGGLQGLLKVQAIVEGTVLDVFTRTNFSYADARDATGATTLTNFLHHFTLDFARTIAKSATGTVRFYLKAIANDLSAAPQIIGPFIVSPRAGLSPAPWGGPAIYDQIFHVDNTLGTKSGSTYTTFIEAMQAAVSAAAKSPLFVLDKNGAYPQWQKASNPVNSSVTSGPALATQLWTVAADPRTVTAAWLGDGTATSGIAPGVDGLRMLGWATKLDVCQFGVGFSIFGTGNAPGTNNQTVVFEGVEFYQGVQTQAPSFSGWNGVIGAGALYNGAIPQTYFLNAHTTGSFGVTGGRYFLECNLRDINFGLSQAIARNCVGNKCFKWHQNMLGSYNSTIFQTGEWNSPHVTPLDAFNIWYTGGATTATISTSGGNTGAITSVILIEDGVSTLTVSVNTATTLTGLVASIAAQAGWNTTLLATTPQVSRSALNIWTGSNPGTPHSQAITTPVVVSHSSGSPTKISTMVDVHCDACSWFTISSAYMQNTIVEGLGVYGKKAGQLFFLDTSLATLDFYLNGESSDDASSLGVGYTSFATTWACPCSNVVIDRTTQMGVGESITFFSGSLGNALNFVGDAYCGIYDSFIETVAFDALANPNGMGLVGIASRTAAITAGGDGNCIALGTSATNGSIFKNALGAAPYSFGGGTIPNMTAANSTVLLEAISGRTVGARNLDGSRKLAA